jgi:hypothetical protein
MRNAGDIDAGGVREVASYYTLLPRNSYQPSPADSQPAAALILISQTTQ